jgi:hypothetical protein
MKLTRFPLVLALALLAGLTASIQPAPAANFDGQWSVLIITEDGTCDRAYRYPVTVTNGVLSYEGEAGVTLSGKVDPSGKINATIRRGEQSANGSGRLSASSGSGTWKGKSSTSACAGTWQAVRGAGCFSKNKNARSDAGVLPSDYSRCAFYRGARIMIICRPSNFGSDSTLAIFAMSSLTRSSSLVPSS